MEWIAKNGQNYECLILQLETNQAYPKNVDMPATKPIPGVLYRNIKKATLHKPKVGSHTNSGPNKKFDCFFMLSQCTIVFMPACPMWLIDYHTT
jgi:hypothetical protein